MGKDLRENSRLEYITTTPGNTDDIKLGAVLRIADSLEKIEQPFKELIRDNEYLRKTNARQRQVVEDLRNSNRGLKAAYTRLKNKTNKNEG